MNNPFGHLILALAVLTAVSVLGVLHTITGTDVFSVIVGVAVGGGVLAGANLGPRPPSGA